MKTKGTSLLAVEYADYEYEDDFCDPGVSSLSASGKRHEFYS